MNKTAVGAGVIVGFLIGDAVAIARANRRFRVILKKNNRIKTLRGQCEVLVIRKNAYRDAAQSLLDGEDPQGVIDKTNANLAFSHIVQGIKNV